MKGKRKANGHKEKRGKQAFKRSIHQRDSEHREFQSEFGRLEGDTIVGQHHKSAVITTVDESFFSQLLQKEIILRENH